MTNPPKLWRCCKCGHVLGEVIDGVCVLKHEVRLSNGAAVVVCPVCKAEVRWYCYEKEERGK